MLRPLHVTSVAFTPAKPLDRAVGLLGWVRVTVNGAFEFDSITVRRAANGQLALGFPGRRDGGGRQRYFVRPLTDAVRVEVEAQVFAQLNQRLREIERLAS